MKIYPEVFLKPGKEAAVKRFHPWIFSGAISHQTGNPVEGDIVEIFSSAKEYLATGHFTGGSIAVKLFSFSQQEIDDTFWKRKLQSAWDLRSSLGLTDNLITNAYRLVFTEGDGLPGLIIDYYNGAVVIQAHSLGMYKAQPALVRALQEIYGDKLKTVYDKSSETLKMPFSQKGSDIQTKESRVKDHYLVGTTQQGLISETGHSFTVDWERGQKTGFFLDQRANRMFAQFYAKDKRVLNAFCYSGAFSVYSLKGGASLVHSVDSSRQAIEWTEENVALNGFDAARHRSFVSDIKKYLSESDEKYDMIILDPPAFAKTHAVTNNALHAYVHINTAAMKRLKAGGLLFTFSCSQAISREMFRSAIQSAALESGREIKILHHLSQGPDHPVSIYHPEGEYLKGLILWVK